MNEIISAIVFNQRAALGKAEKMKDEIKRLSEEKDNSYLELEVELKQKLNEATAVIIIFDDLIEEVEGIISSYQSSVGSNREIQKSRINKGVQNVRTNCCSNI